MADPLGPWSARPDTAQKKALATAESVEAHVLTEEIAGSTDIDGRMLWSLMLLSEGRAEEARSVLEPALGADEAPARLRVLWALVSSFEGPDAGEDLEDLSEALLDSPEADVPAFWMVLGRLLEERGRAPAARSAFDRAAAAYGREGDYSGLAHALREAALVLAAEGDLDGARALLATANRRLPRDDEMRLLLRLDEARLHALGADWKACRAALEAALHIAEQNLSPDHDLIAHTLLSLAAARLELGDAGSDTEKMLERAHGLRMAREPEASPGSVEAALLLAECHRLNGRLDAALPLFARGALAREKNGEPPEAAAQAFLLWSRALTEAGQDEAAAKMRARGENYLSHEAKRARDR